MSDNNSNNEEQSLSDIILEDEQPSMTISDKPTKPPITKRTVRIKKLDLKSWHGKTGKEDFSRPKTITALVDGSTGKYKTGLTEAEEKYYSNLLGAELNSNFSINEPHPFWDTAAGRFRLTNGTTVLNLDNPR